MIDLVDIFFMYWQEIATIFNCFQLLSKNPGISQSDLETSLKLIKSKYIRINPIIKKRLLGFIFELAKTYQILKLVVRHQAITWANVDTDLSPYGVTRINEKEISLYITEAYITNRK